jgi:hypothetical protein
MATGKSIKDLEARIKALECCCIKELLITDGIPTEAPTNSRQVLAFDPVTGIFYYYDGNSWETYTSAESASNGLIIDGGDVVLGDNAEGVTEPGVFTSDRYLNLDGNSLIYAVDNRVALGVSGGGTVRRVLDLQTGSTLSFDEWIGTTDNAGVGAPNNFTYYRGFNLDTTGNLIDPTKHGVGEGFEFHFEPVTGEIYTERHYVLNIAGTSYRIDSHTLPIAEPENWSLYHTLNTWFLKSSTDDGQFAEFDWVNATTSNFNLLASGQVQKGVQFTVTHDGTNNGVQIIPFGASTGKSISLAQWYDAALPSLTCLNTPGDPNGKLTFVNDRLYPSADNDCELGADSFRYKQIHGTSLKISDPADVGQVKFEVFAAGNTHIDTVAIAQVNNASGLAHGTYTPTSSSTDNINGLSMAQAQYMRVGNTVTISGGFTVDANGAGTTRFEIDLPVASVLATDSEAAGVAVNSIGTVARIHSFTSADMVRFTWEAPDSNSNIWSYSFTYVVT